MLLIGVLLFFSSFAAPNFEGTNYESAYIHDSNYCGIINPSITPINPLYCGNEL